MARKKALTPEQAETEAFMDQWEGTKSNLGISYVNEEDEATPEDKENIEENSEAEAKADDTSTEDIKNQEGTTSSETNHDWEKRAKDGQRYIQELKDQLKDVSTKNEGELNELRKQISDGTFGGKPKTAEEMKAFQEANPELFDYVENMIHNRTVEVSTKLEADLEKERVARSQLEHLNKMTELKKIHADADTIESSPEFTDWLSTQSSLTKKMVSSKESTVADLAFVIRNYKEAKGIADTPKSKSKKAQAAAAATSSSAGTPSSNTKVWTTSEIRKMNDRQFAEHEAEIDKAYLEDRIVDDTQKLF